jgi:hypothetical protein
MAYRGKSADRHPYPTLLMMHLVAAWSIDVLVGIVKIIYANVRSDERTRERGIVSICGHPPKPVSV